MNTMSMEYPISILKNVIIIFHYLEKVLIDLNDLKMTFLWEFFCVHLYI